jgi:hypothetical protein
LPPPLPTITVATKIHNLIADPVRGTDQKKSGACNSLEARAHALFQTKCAEADVPDNGRGASAIWALWETKIKPAMHKMAAIVKNIDAQNPSGTTKGDLKRQNIAEDVYSNDGSATTTRVKWDKSWWTRAYPAAVRYFGSAKRALAESGDVGSKKAKLAVNLKKMGETLQSGIKEASSGMKDALVTMTGAMKSNHEAMLDVERAKSASLQQFSDVRLALALEGDMKKKMLEAMAAQRLKQLMADNDD